jgi:methyl-accepting chemotaxis protein WspA
VKLSVKLTLKRKIIAITTLAAILPVMVILLLTVHFKNVVSNKAGSELDVLARVNITQISKDVYTLCETANTLIQRKVHHDLLVAQETVHKQGAVSLSAETVEWEVINQETQKTQTLRLPKMLIGGKWLGKNSDISTPTPIVDDIYHVVGSNCTIFQRIDPKGNMIRVATNVKNNNNARAVGTMVTAFNADGTPNPVIETILQGKEYQGLAYVVNSWNITAYSPLKNSSGQIVGMLYTGEKLEMIETIRKGIISTKVGNTGYVAALGGKGAHRGHYIISRNGERDGEDIWDSKDGKGTLFIQEMVNRALGNKPGELFIARYFWKNPGDPAAKPKIAAVTYFAPWDWVIFTTMYEDDFYQAKSQIRKVTLILLGQIVVGGLLILMLAILFAVFVGERLTRPLTVLSRMANKIATGDIQEARRGLAAFSRQFKQKDFLIFKNEDETGLLLDAFNTMIDSLDSLIGKVQYSGTQVSNLADEIALSVQQLQATVVEQAASTREVTATSREISTTSKTLVNTMDGVSEKVADTEIIAEAGRVDLINNESVMRQLINATGSIASKLAVINEKANKITGVITTINKISDQTNLLSLNAAIEAEKAGDYGKGFSVVAREISRLADKTALATQDIEFMVKGMQSSVASGVMEMDKFAEEVRRGVEQVVKIGEQLGGIIDQVRAIGPQFETVKESMQLQEQGALQISEAIGQLAVAADQTKESLNEFRTAIDRANNAVQELQTEVSRFKISE